MMPPHLLADISSHGYGHVAQTAPVVNELTRRHPGLRVTLRCGAPEALLRQRFECDFALIPETFDFGMVMADAAAVSVDESAAAYREFHRDWRRRVAREARAMKRLAPDLLLANVPYLSLAAAAELGIPSIAMCSLNWADIYRHYCGGRPEAAAIHGEMLAAYNSAACFLKLQPGMPMDDLSSTRPISPVSHGGAKRRDEIVARLGMAEGEKLVLAAMGGFHLALDMAEWPRLSGVRWAVPAAWEPVHPDAVTLESLHMPFGDILASCDVLLTKPGYGSFAEAACSGVPVLYLSRPDWPEQPYLVDWLQRHGRCREISRRQLERGDLGGGLAALLAAARPPAVAATGMGEAADVLDGFLNG